MTFLIQRLIGRLRKQAIATAATSRQELCPAEETIGKSALMADGNIDAIIDLIPGSNTQLEMNRILGRPCVHFPTIAYELPDVRIQGPYFASGWRYQKYDTGRPSADRTDHGFIPEAFLSTNMLSGKEFGHWLRDAMVSEIYGATLGIPAIGLVREPWLHEPAYREIGQLACLYAYKARVGRLVMLDDRGLNSHWGNRFLQLRDRMRKGVAHHPGESSGELIFLDRGEGARMRDPTNLEELKEALAALGFRTITPTGMNANEIGVALRHARLAVSVEGSHLNHLHCFAPDSLTLITLQDPRRFSAHHKRIIDLYGDRFGIVVGAPDPETRARYRIDIGLLRQVIDKAA